jgi:hypothetical protein
MARHETIPLDQKVGIKLTATERKLLDQELILEYKEVIHGTPIGDPVMLTLDEWEDLNGYIAAQANHTEDMKVERKLDKIFGRIQNLIDKNTEEESPQSLKMEDAKNAKMVSDQAVEIAEWAAQALVAAEQLRIKTKPVGSFPLLEAERNVLAILPAVPSRLKKKLLKQDADFTVAEVASMAMSVAESLPDGEPLQQVSLLMIAKGLMDCLKERIVGPTQPTHSKKTSKPSKTLYQFKITLLQSEPAIWRRIQVQDCTLDKLHEHIQTTMGWTNSHLHQFEINGERHGDLELLDDGFDDFECVDSTTTMVSDIVPKSGERCAFKYEYDFGDGWEHEVLFEGCPPIEKRKKYPLCLEGERACPPEDVGGVLGYQDFLAAIADPKHEEHETLIEWSGGSFSPEHFDPKKATREMKKGLPDWRTM